MIITRAPLRVSLFGGGTDFPEYYRTALNGGAVLGFALDRYVYVTARCLPPFFGHKHRLVWSRIELVNEVDAIQNPIYRAALRNWPDSAGGLELHYDADLPARSGLGSSSSFAVALLLALGTLRGYASLDADLGRTLLAVEAIDLERGKLKEPGGVQDQLWAAYGGFGRFDFARNFGAEFKPLGDLTALLSHLLLFYTGQQRTASQLESLKIERLSANRAHLDRLRAQVDEAEAYLAREDYPALGALLDEAWCLKRTLAPGVTYPDLNAAYAAARAAGAWGGKLLGAGGGGFLLIMASPDRFPAIRGALSEFLEVPVGWSPTGAGVVFNGEAK